MRVGLVVVLEQADLDRDFRDQAPTHVIKEFAAFYNVFLAHAHIYRKQELALLLPSSTPAEPSPGRGWSEHIELLHR